MICSIMKRIVLISVLLFTKILTFFSQDIKNELEIGIGLYQDFAYPEAVAHLEKALELGYIDAYYYIGKIYDADAYSPYDREQVLPLRNKAFMEGAQKGNAKCEVEYAKILLKNRTKSDSVQAFRYLEDAKDKKIGSAYFLLARLAKENKLKLELYQEALCLGEKPYHELAELYRYGDTRDYSKAIMYAKKALFENQYHVDDTYDIIESLSILGQSYYWIKDYMNSAKYLMPFYHLCPGWGRVIGQCVNYLGYLYYFGKHKELEDKTRGRYFFEYSADCWCNDSKNRLGEIIRNETKDVKRKQWASCFYLFPEQESKTDKQDALNILSKNIGPILRAINEGTTIVSPYDYYIVAFCYENGYCGLPVDTIQALAYYNKVRESESKDIDVIGYASLRIAEIYYKKYVNAGYSNHFKQLAIQHYQESAKTGNIAAIRTLYIYKKEIALLYSRQFGFCDNDVYLIDSLYCNNTKQTLQMRGEKYLELYNKGFFIVQLDGINQKYKWDEFWPFHIEGKKLTYQSDRYSANNMPHTSQTGLNFKFTLDEAAEAFYLAGMYDRVVGILSDTTANLTPKGKAFLGLCYYHGRGVEKNMDKALSLIKEAAEHGSETAMTALGNDYRHKNDYNKAIRWYRRAAHYGSKEGMLNLALCYDRGLGLAKNSHLAKLWMYKAQKLGINDK